MLIKLYKIKWEEDGDKRAQESEEREEKLMFVFTSQILLYYPRWAHPRQDLAGGDGPEVVEHESLKRGHALSGHVAK